MPLRFRSLLENGGRKLLALNLGEIHASLLKNAPLPHNPGTTTSTFRADPALLFEAALAVESLKPGTDLILKTHHHRSGPFSGIARRQLQGRLSDCSFGASENPADQGANHALQTVIWKPNQTTPAIDKVP
jgi:hypothetical protein